MVNWSDPDEVAKDADVLHKLVFALFGAYIWELFTTCDFEWSLLTKRRKFRLPLVRSKKFLNLDLKLTTSKSPSSILPLSILHAPGLRWALTERTSPGIRSIALYTFNSWTGNMAILCASSSLMLRTFALWERRLSVVIPLGILCVAHWALLYRTMFIVVAQWDPQAKACVVVQTNPSLLNITFFFTMGFDLVILISTAAALLARHSVRTDLWKLLFQDGLVYFIVSFSTNCIPAVLNVLNLNSESLHVPPTVQTN
ncbi:hypothetical protein CVT26_008518 [Gymnopilus dilepis]|uniref:G-protein coupled receptors family 1 profile domain-containing protein n=1 Tax=Gymnopilus dilepis TaxID=231916 RepID=A0A409XXJ7_9AGAR|nr:hypothetical protein CVT26_008518 [Gymnopilus dilepis]